MSATLEYLGTVLAWDEATGIGRIQQDLFDQKQPDIDRSLLVDTGSLAVGQRVAFVEALESDASGGSDWKLREVRPVADDAAYWAGQLEGLCRAVDSAETDLNVASEAAGEDTVAEAQADFANASDRRDTKVKDIGHHIVACCTSTEMAQVPGFADTLYARGDEAALHAVLDRIDESHRGVVLHLWTPLLQTLAEIRENDYLPH